MTLPDPANDRDEPTDDDIAAVVDDEDEAVRELVYLDTDAEILVWARALKERLRQTAIDNANTFMLVSMALSVALSFVVDQRDEAQAESAHYQRLAADLNHAALTLGEPWNLMVGVGGIAADLNDGTASGWVGWLNNIDPATSCIDGPRYVVCAAVKETCWEAP